MSATTNKPSRPGFHGYRRPGGRVGTRNHVLVVPTVICSAVVAERVAVRGDQHYGLLGMKERAKRIGGRLEVSGPPGEGTTVRVSVALRDVETGELPSPAPFVI